MEPIELPEQRNNTRTIKTDAFYRALRQITLTRPAELPGLARPFATRLEEWKQVAQKSGIDIVQERRQLIKNGVRGWVNTAALVRMGVFGAGATLREK